MTIWTLIITTLYGPIIWPLLWTPCTNFHFCELLGKKFSKRVVTNFDKAF